MDSVRWCRRCKDFRDSTHPDMVLVESSRGFLHIAWTDDWKAMCGQNARKWQRVEDAEAHEEAPLAIPA